MGQELVFNNGNFEVAGTPNAPGNNNLSESVVQEVYSPASNQASPYTQSGYAYIGNLPGYQIIGYPANSVQPTDYTTLGNQGFAQLYNGVASIAGLRDGLQNNPNYYGVPPYYQSQNISPYTSAFASTNSYPWQNTYPQAFTYQNQSFVPQNYLQNSYLQNLAYQNQILAQQNLQNRPLVFTYQNGVFTPSVLANTRTPEVTTSNPQQARPASPQNNFSMPPGVPDVTQQTFAPAPQTDTSNRTPDNAYTPVAPQNHYSDIPHNTPHSQTQQTTEQPQKPTDKQQKPAEQKDKSTEQKPEQESTDEVAPGWDTMKNVLAHRLGKQISEIHHGRNLPDNPDCCSYSIGDVLIEQHKQMHQKFAVNHDIALVVGLEQTLTDNGYKRVSQDDMRPGDVIIAYRNVRAGDGHAGIYIGTEMDEVSPAHGQEMVFNNDSLAAKNGTRGVMDLNRADKFFNSEQYYRERKHLTEKEAKEWKYNDIRIYRAPENA